MAEPNKVDDYVPYRVLKYVEARLKQISIALGYNTDPFVTRIWEDAENSTAKHTIYLVSPGGTPVESGVGSGKAMQPTINFEIEGFSKYETEDPQMVSMGLEQDVKTAVHSDIENIRDSVGRACSVTFGASTYDEETLVPFKEAGFRLVVTFTWSQKGNW